MDTIGDAYVVIAAIDSEAQCREFDSNVSGLESKQTKSRIMEEILSLALVMQQAIKDIGGASLRESCRRQHAQHDPLFLRVGIAEGHVISGVIGARQPRYQVFGPALTLAEKFQRHARPGDILVQPSIANQISPLRFEFSSVPTRACNVNQGPVEIGETIDSRLLIGKVRQNVQGESEEV